MRLSIVCFSLLSVIWITGCGGGGSTSGSPAVYTSADLENDYLNLATSESRLEKCGFRFKESSWRINTEAYLNTGRDEKIEALQTYIQAAQTFLNRYGNGSIIIKKSDGVTENHEGLGQGEIAKLQKRIYLCQVKVEDLQAGDPLDGPKTAKRDRDYDDEVHSRYQ